MKKALFPQLDGLRGIAALTVLIHHYWPGAFFWDPTDGRLGADLFFVLSGFLITRTLLKARSREDRPRTHTLRDFYVRRLVRILPMYYGVLFLVLGLRWDLIGPGIWWHLGFLSNVYFITQGGFTGAGSHFWTLAVEQHFYLIWPLVILFIPQAALKLVPVFLIAAGLFFRLLAGWAGWSNITIDVMTPGAFETLGMGALLAFWQQNDVWNPRRDRRLHFFGLCGFLLNALLVALPLSAAKDTLALLLTELARALFLGWLVGQAIPGLPGVIGRFLQSGPARLLGQASFGIYLTHNFFLAVIPFWGWSIGPIPAHVVQTMSAFGATILWAVICYYALERPFLRRRS